jgi:hypothetical protein
MPLQTTKRPFAGLVAGGFGFGVADATTGFGASGWSYRLWLRRRRGLRLPVEFVDSLGAQVLPDFIDHCAAFGFRLRGGGEIRATTLPHARVIFVVDRVEPTAAFLIGPVGKPVKDGADHLDARIPGDAHAECVVVSEGRLGARWRDSG